MLKVKDIRKMFIDRFDESLSMQEIIGQSFVADEESIFGRVNYEYVRKEIDWYKKESLFVNDLEDAPSIWRQISSNHGMINSNYGWCVFNQMNNNQFSNVLDHLIRDKNSRRAVMIYTRPSMHNEYNYDDMNDFICTNAVNYFIRDDKLSCVVQMRSNDVIYGYKNDRAWQSYILERLYVNLKEFYSDLKLGDIIWNAASLHIYPKHYGLINELSR